MTFIIALILTASAALFIRHRLQRKKKKEARRKQERWSIGLYEGADPVTLIPMKEIVNPILKPDTDINARFIADPFMIMHNGEYWLFFEVMNSRRNKGEIGCARSFDLKKWNYHGIILRERFHLSYPSVFEHEGKIYMVPECAKSNAVRLYRANTFPGDWQHETSLIKGNRHRLPLLDPSIFYHEGLWYLFTYRRKTQNLHLFTSPSLTGEWKEHPKSPVVNGSPHFARPGGRIVKGCNQIYRFAQDGIPHYGSKVWAFRITELSENAYLEEQVPDRPVIQAGNEEWNNSGMHTVDAHQQETGRLIAFVDGLEHKKMNRRANKNARNKSKP
jgi:hypothetical protein